MPDTPSWTRKTNLGVQAARADHVCTLHQDDLWLENRVADFEGQLSRHPETTMFLSSSLIIDGNGRKLGPWRIPAREGLCDRATLRDALLVQNSIAIPAPVIRRDAWLAVGGLDEALWYTPDWDLWLKLVACGPVAYQDRSSTAFRVHGNSLTMTGDRNEFAEELELVLSRHIPSGSRDKAVFHASIEVNVLLARAAAGSWGSLLKALATILALGPRDAVHYIRTSRLFERALPRLRARLAGAL
jgi:hypothetical protein